MLIVRRAPPTNTSATARDDHKGKHKASPPSSPLTDIDNNDEPDAESEDDKQETAAPPAKRTRQSLRGKASEVAYSTVDKGKGKAKAVGKGKKAEKSMPRKTST